MKQIKKIMNKLFVSGLLLILICSGCHLQNRTENMDESYWEENETVDTISIGDLLSDRWKGTFTVSFDSLHEAETKLMAVLDPYVQDEVGGRYRNNNELVEVVMNHPETLGYPFARLAEREYVDILTSQDGHLRFYCWDDGRGGTAISYKLICQYQSEGKVYGYVDYGNCLLELHTIESLDKEVFYIVLYYSRASSTNSSMWLESIAARNGSLIYLPVFPGGTHQLVLYEDEPGWNAASDTDERRMTVYDSKKKNLYVLSNLDYYDVYHYNGKFFEYAGKKSTRVCQNKEILAFCHSERSEESRK